MIKIKQAMSKEVYSSESGPVVVHCPSGVGKTGLVIGLDTLVQQIEDQKPGLEEKAADSTTGAAADTIDIYGCVFRIREDRGFMVIK